MVGGWTSFAIFRNYKAANRAIEASFSEANPDSDEFALLSFWKRPCGWDLAERDDVGFHSV